MDKYDYTKAKAQFTTRELVTIGGKKGELHDLAMAIQEAKDKVGDEVKVEELIGLLRHEANQMELAYIRSAERIQEDLEEVAEDEMIQRFIDEEIEEADSE